MAKIYGNGTQAQVTILKQSLSALKKEDESIEAYMERAKKIYNQLFALDQSVAESDVVEHMLFGLDKSNHMFAHSVSLRLELIHSQNSIYICLVKRCWSDRLVAQPRQRLLCRQQTTHVLKAKMVTVVVGEVREEEMVAVRTTTHMVEDMEKGTSITPFTKAPI